MWFSKVVSNICQREDERQKTSRVDTVNDVDKLRTRNEILTMASHHPPRPCFSTVEFFPLELRARATFTEQRKIETPPTEIWDFTTTDAIAYGFFATNPNGVFFNANVRDQPVWTATRIS